MNTVSRHAIPCNSDGLIIPRLIPVAAYLCCEDYGDAARSRVLERLADGVSPRACCLVGALEWSDLAEVERLVGARTPAGEDLPPVSGGAPFEPSEADWAWLREQDERREALEELRAFEAACEPECRFGYE